MDRYYLEITRLKWKVIKTLNFNNIIILIGLIISALTSAYNTIIALIVLLLINNLILVNLYVDLIHKEKNEKK